MVDPINNTDNNHLCLHRSYVLTVNGDKVNVQACLPKGGLNNLNACKAGDVFKMRNGEKYQVIQCKFPRCI